MRKFNAKRKLESPPVTKAERDELKRLSDRASYTGNPVHKRNPGDFKLIPPAAARGDKNLCDRAGIFRRSEAQRLLRKGIRMGLISVAEVNGWPKNVWAVASNGVALEAMREGDGQYHGYSLPEADPLVADIRKRWDVE